MYYTGAANIFFIPEVTLEKSFNAKETTDYVKELKSRSLELMSTFLEILGLYVLFALSHIIALL